MSEDPIRLRAGDRTYVWVEPWAQLPETGAQQASFPHSAIALLETGELVIFDQAQKALLFLDLNGRLRRAAPVAIDEAHGVTAVVDNAIPYVWLADAAVARRPEAGYVGPTDTSRSAAVKVRLDGTIEMSLERPPHPAYEFGGYRPTCVAVFEKRFGGNGDIWVGDGYGESYVHRYDRDGRYLGSLSGEEGAGRFDTPHALYVDRRRGEAEMYIADRANGRIQVYGMDGRFRRVIEGFFSRPTWIARDGDNLIVVEYTPPRVTILDAQDRLIRYLAEGPVILQRPGWPNELDADGNARRPTLRPGQFNSPHAVAVDAEGNLYISEFLIGGRLVKLKRTAS